MSDNSISRIPVLSDIQQVSDGWIKKYVLTYAMPDGSQYSYESVSRKGLDAYRRELERNAHGEQPTPDAVCIVPQTRDGKLVLIREFRYPLNSWCIAFPAGLVDEGESIADCVRRELAEETGYALRDGAGEAAVQPLPQTGYSSTGMAEENVQVVFAQVDRRGAAHTEPSEFIEVFELPVSGVRRFLDENKTPIGTRCQLILEMFARQG